MLKPTMTTTDITDIITYQNGSYAVSILTDGTKIRTQMDSGNKVNFPESIDIKITDWCDAGCKWCHEDSTKSGIHADINYLKKLIDGLPPGVELAIGGGHPMAHPKFEDFLLFAKSKGLIANVTVNQVHYKKAFEKLEQYSKIELLYGIGLSVKSLFTEYLLPNMVFHVIVGIHDPAWIEKSLQNMPKIKMLILGYKTHGRGENFMKIDESVFKKWIRYLPSLSQHADIAFDTLAIQQLKPQNLFLTKNYDKFFMGDEGSFSMYIDAVKQEYALSSYSKERFRINKTIPECFKDLQNGS